MRHLQSFVRTSALLLAGLLLSLPVLSEEERRQGLHPLMYKDWLFNVGVFFPDRSLKFSAEGGREFEINDEIDFPNTFKLSKDSQEMLAQLRWHFGRKWSMEAEYFTTKASNTITLQETIEWEGVEFEAGGFVEGGASFDVTRFFLTRDFVQSEKNHFAAGVGLHWLDIGAYIEGEGYVDDKPVGFGRHSAGVSAPLPNIGMWYVHAVNDRWALTARIDWFSASYKEYSGQFWNATAGVNYAFNENFGASLRYMYFDLDVGVKDERWRGNAEVEMTGPLLMLNATW